MVFLVKLSKDVAGEVNKRPSGNATSDQNVQQREVRLNLTIYLVYPGFELHYCINIKEFSICIFYRCFTCILNCAMHCIVFRSNGNISKKLWRMS